MLANFVRPKRFVLPPVNRNGPPIVAAFIANVRLRCASIAVLRFSCR